MTFQSTILCNNKCIVVPVIALCRNLSEVGGIHSAKTTKPVDVIISHWQIVNGNTVSDFARPEIKPKEFHFTNNVNNYTKWQVLHLTTADYCKPFPDKYLILFCGPKNCFCATSIKDEDNQTANQLKLL